MAIIKYRPESPYFNTPQLKKSLEFYKHREILPSVDDKSFVLTMKYEHRPDRLSYDLYGTSNYWWVFQVRNMDKFSDPIWEFVTGLEIIIPSKKTVLGLMS